MKEREGPLLGKKKGGPNHRKEIHDAGKKKKKSPIPRKKSCGKKGSR